MRLHKIPAVYSMSNKRNGRIYTGVTSELIARVYQHKYSKKGGFTHRYDCRSLVYYELHDNMYNAISREKQIKAGSRKNKIALIERINPEWCDLYSSIL